MSTLVIRTRYRPLRVGWCIRNGNFEDFDKALRLTHCLWGGRYNPVIPVNDAGHAASLVRIFKVDVLVPISADDPATKQFIESFPHLPWPFHGEGIFKEINNHKESNVLDIRHPVVMLSEQRDTNHRVTATIFEWKANDPLGRVFLALFGGYPRLDEVGIDYREFVSRRLEATLIPIFSNAALPDDAFNRFVPSTITTLDLEPEQWTGSWDGGFYVGDAGDFRDLVTFWNLRAADVDLFFFDPKCTSRLSGVRKAIERAFRDLPPHPSISERRPCFYSLDVSEQELEERKKMVPEISLISTDWRMLSLRAPLMCFKSSESVGSVAEGSRGPTVTFHLGRRPFVDKPPIKYQHVIVTVQPSLDLSRERDFTFSVPCLPELNTFLGRQMWLDADQIRAEPEGLGIITDAASEHLTLFALNKRALISKVFEQAGMKATPSRPGQICTQLIRQMGGVQACRVFKIKGVRELIERFGPSQDFTRSAAIQTIGQNDPATGQPRFSDFERLYIEPREAGKLKPPDVFDFLLKKGVFRVGLRLTCPSCQLDFWKPLDEVKTKVPCEYCGNEFLISPQLRDRDWAYRRSGLFGRADNQGGSIPVAVILQQLDRTLSTKLKILLPAMELTSITANIESCETDFVVFVETHQGRVQLAIGEAKANGIIEDSDIAKLTRVGTAFPNDRIDVFILFGKTSPFSDEEIERCRAANATCPGRVILLSDRELEPYDVYERAPKECGLNRSLWSLEELARATHLIYFSSSPLLPHVT